MKELKNLNDMLKKSSKLSEDEAFQLICDMRKVAFDEQGKDTIIFFDDESIFLKLISLGDKFIDNEKLLENLVSLIGVQTRFKDYHEMFNINYDFLFRHRLHRNKNIKYLVSHYLHNFPNFQKKWEGKWDYILEIPKLPPKKHSKDSFIWSIYENKNDIPEEYKTKILEQIEKILSKGYYISEIAQKRYDEILDILKK